MVTAAPQLTSRAAAVERLTSALDAACAAHGCGWAFQGMAGAVQDWCARTDSKDLDVWVPSRCRGAVTAALADLGAVRVVAAEHPARLRHDVWLLPLPSGPGVIDVTYGPLMLGAVALLVEADVTVTEDHQLAGVARFADLFTRAVLKGRAVDVERLSEARRLYAADPARVRAHLCRALGARLAARAVRVLRDGTGLRALHRGARLRVAWCAAHPSTWPAAWQERARIVPTFRPGPAGLRHRGVLVDAAEVRPEARHGLAAGLREAGLRPVVVPLTAGGRLVPAGWVVSALAVLAALAGRVVLVTRPASPSFGLRLHPPRAGRPGPGDVEVRAVVAAAVRSAHRLHLPHR